MSDSMIQIAYVSFANFELSDGELDDILVVSRKNNKEADITGYLMYCERSFFQVIEGPEKAMRALYSTIEKDHRHSRVTQLLDRPIVSRLFGDWQMAFRRFDQKESVPSEGYSSMLSSFLGNASPDLPPSNDIGMMIETFRRNCLHV